MEGTSENWKASPGQLLSGRRPAAARRAGGGGSRQGALPGGSRGRESRQRWAHTWRRHPGSIKGDVIRELLRGSPGARLPSLWVFSHPGSLVTSETLPSSHPGQDHRAKVGALRVHPRGGVCPDPGPPEREQGIPSKTDRCTRQAKGAGLGTLIFPDDQLGQIILGCLGKCTDLHCICEARTRGIPRALSYYRRNENNK